MVKEVEKVWGREIWMANNKNYCGKQLILNKGYRCSLHSHKEKHETFYIDKGRVLMEWGDNEKVLGVGKSVAINPGVKHRFSGLEDSVIIEISTHHEDSDSFREEGQLSGEIPFELKVKYSLI